MNDYSSCALCGSKTQDSEWVIIINKKVVCDKCSLKINPSVTTFSEYIVAATPSPNHNTVHTDGTYFIHR